MKILLLTDINSSHSRKWAKGLADRGIRVGIFSISSPTEDWYTASSIEVFIPVKFKPGVFSSGIFRKIKYLKLVLFIISLRNNGLELFAHFILSKIILIILIIFLIFCWPL